MEKAFKICILCVLLCGIECRSLVAVPISLKQFLPVALSDYAETGFSIGSNAYLVRWTGITTEYDMTNGRKIRDFKAAPLARVGNDIRVPLKTKRNH